MNEEKLRAEANNFTVVRLVLASAVIYTHSYWLTSGVSGKDDVSDLLGAPISVFAVDGFFFLSGFLVYPSLLRFGKVAPFLLARLARLWPALAASIILTVIGGAFVTTAQGVDYLGGDTARFIISNGSLLQGALSLTGVACNGEPCVVNGSLWTLPWEARCYLGLALLSLLGLASPVMMKRLVLPGAIAYALIWDVPAVRAAAHSVVGDGGVFYLDTIDRLWTLFVLGAGAYIYRARLPLSWIILLGLFVAMLAANAFGVDAHTRTLFVGYAVLCCGLLTAEKGAFSGHWPDYSYGMYIYAFPVMLVVHSLMPGASYWALAAANFAATLPLAAVSWHYIEKPVLEMVRRGRARRRTPVSSNV